MYEIIIILLIIVDQMTKISIKDYLQTKGSITIIENFFNLTYVENRGAAFGIFQNGQIFFVAIAVIVVIAGLYFLHRAKTTILGKISVCMILAGAIGNLIDRIRLGYVIDFFDFRFIWSYVFNFADILVVVGTFLLCLYIIISGKDETNEQRK